MFNGWSGWECFIFPGHVFIWTMSCVQSTLPATTCGTGKMFHMFHNVRYSDDLFVILFDSISWAKQ